APEEPAPKRHAGLRRLGHRPVGRLGRLLWKARSQGHASWIARLPVDQVRPSTRVQRCVNRTAAQRGEGKANSAFVAAMEDVQAVYTRPRDGDCPLVCLDETSKQLIAETRVPIPMKAGRPARFD